MIPVLCQARRSRRTLCSSASPTDVESVAGPKSGGVPERKVRKKAEWRPSEAHRVAATSVHRKEVRSSLPIFMLLSNVLYLRDENTYEISLEGDNGASKIVPLSFSSSICNQCRKC